MDIEIIQTDCTMDLNQELITHPHATFFVRATGTSMTGAGIFPEDILIVDKSLEATDKKVIIAVVNGELTVKLLMVVIKCTKNGRLKVYHPGAVW